jgi:transcriptional regulator with GAF, ATPase, and Fis domain
MNRNQTTTIDPDKSRMRLRELLNISTDLQCDIVDTIARLHLDDSIQIGLSANLLQIIVQQVSVKLNAPNCAIFLIDGIDTPVKGEKRVAHWAAGTGQFDEKQGWKSIAYDVIPSEEVEHKNPKQRLGITGYAMSTGEVIVCAGRRDVHSHPHHLGQNITDDTKLGAFLLVPIKALEGHVIGCLKAERSENLSLFDELDQLLMETFAQVARKVISYAARGDWTQANQQISTIICLAVEIISEAVLSMNELDEFLDVIVRVICSSTQFQSSSIFLKETDGRTLTQRAGFGGQELKTTIRAYRLPLDTASIPDLDNLCSRVLSEKRIGLTSWIAVTNRAFFAANFEELSAHPHHKGTFDKINYTRLEQCGAFYGVPLRIGDVTTGVLKIENTQVEGTGKSVAQVDKNNVMKLMDAIAPVVAISIKRFQLKNQFRFEGLKVAKERIFGFLRSDMDLDQLAKTIVSSVGKLFGSKFCGLFLKDGNYLIQPREWAQGYSVKGPWVRSYRLVDENTLKDPLSNMDKVGLTVWIAATRKQFVARSFLELTSHPHHKGKFDSVNFIEVQNEGCMSFMGMPLTAGKELIGVLKVENKTNERGITYFGEEDEFEFDLMSDVAAMAIRNAKTLEAKDIQKSLSKIAENQPKSGFVGAIDEIIRGKDIIVDLLIEAVTAPSEYSITDNLKKIVIGISRLLEEDFSKSSSIELQKLIGQTEECKYLSFLNEMMEPSSLMDLHKLPFSAISSPIFDKTVLFKCTMLLTERLNYVKNMTSTRSDSDYQVKITDCIVKLTSEVERCIEEGALSRLERSIIVKILNDWIRVLSSEQSRNMSLKYLRLQDTDFYEDFIWEFQGGINIILGRNGYGKSYLLKLLLSMMQRSTEGSESFFAPISYLPKSIHRSAFDRFLSNLPEESKDYIRKVYINSDNQNEYFSQVSAQQGTTLLLKSAETKTLDILNLGRRTEIELELDQRQLHFRSSDNYT